MSDKEFSFTYHFNTSYLEEKDKESLALIAEETKCTLEIDESSATLKAPVLFSTMLNIYAGRPLSVYNALKDAFLDDHIFPV
jgi:hypothetical protein